MATVDYKNFIEFKIDEDFPSFDISFHDDQYVKDRDIELSDIIKLSEFIFSATCFSFHSKDVTINMAQILLNLKIELKKNKNWSFVTGDESRLILKENNKCAMINDTEYVWYNLDNQYDEIKEKIINNNHLSLNVLKAEKFKKNSDYCSLDDKPCDSMQYLLLTTELVTFAVPRSTVARLCHNYYSKEKQEDSYINALYSLVGLVNFTNMLIKKNGLMIHVDNISYIKNGDYWSLMTYNFDTVCIDEPVNESIKNDVIVNETKDDQLQELVGQVSEQSDQIEKLKQTTERLDVRINDNNQKFTECIMQLTHAMSGLKN